MSVSIGISMKGEIIQQLVNEHFGVVESIEKIGYWLHVYAVIYSYLKVMVKRTHYSSGNMPRSIIFGGIPLFVYTLYMYTQGNFQKEI